MSDYYTRTTAERGAFATADDSRSEDEVAAMIGERMRCEVRHFGQFSAVDWYMVRNGRLVGVAELKTRSHDSGKYPTVFLNVRKWLALLLAEQGLGVPAAYFVRFADGVRWVKVGEIDASQVRIGGCARIVKSRNDIEPVIEIPVEQMRAFACSES